VLKSRSFAAVATMLTALASFSTQPRADEVTLYEGNGEPVAYIDTDDEMTIRMWSGEAVAYLEDAGDGNWYVYGWNGQHLGWFERGVIWNTRGRAQCAIRQALTVAPFAEPGKFGKLGKFAPWAKPAYVNAFDRVPCDTFLKTGE